MKHAAVGCLMGLGSWLLLALAWAGLLQWRYEAPLAETLGVSTLAGLVGYVALSLLHAAWQAWRERAAIISGRAGAPPADGKRVVLVGSIEALGPLLRAPLDNAACIAYDYKITEDRGSGRRRMILTHFRGTRLTPCEIVTRSGRHRLLTVPDLQTSPPAGPSAGHIAAFERYAHGTTFSGADTAAKEWVARWTDDDGAYRSDVSYAPLASIDLTRCMLAQQQVRAGAMVCAIGWYSKARGGLVPSPTWSGNPRLIEEDVNALVQTLNASARKRLLLGTAAALASSGLVAAFVSYWQDD
jgi:hypothetical protein